MIKIDIATCDARESVGVPPPPLAAPSPPALRQPLPPSQIYDTERAHIMQLAASARLNRFDLFVFATDENVTIVTLLATQDLQRS